MLRGTDLLGGQQCRAHVEGMGDDAIGFLGSGNQTRRGVGEPDGGQRPCQVEGRQRVPLDAGPGRVHGIEGDAVGTGDDLETITRIIALLTTELDRRRGVLSDLTVQAETLSRPATSTT